MGAECAKAAAGFQARPRVPLSKDPSYVWIMQEVSFRDWVRRVKRELEPPAPGFMRQFFAVVRHADRMDQECSSLGRRFLGHAENSHTSER